jgi:tetratricopeptide (TPR) repeat protein
VSRSKCYMNLGRFDNAIEDADAALTLDTKYYKGFLQKAESLYACGKFEFALVYYYKGFLLRKDIQEFRRGIRKAKIAINESIEQDSLDEQLSKTNSFGNLVRQRANMIESIIPMSQDSNYLSTTTPSLESSLNVARKGMAEASVILSKTAEHPPVKVVEQKMAEMLKLPEKDIKSPLPPHMTEDYPGKMGAKPVTDSVDKKKLNRKNLLGEFTADEKYLQDLLKDKTFKKDIDGTTKDSKIYDLVESTLSYLEKRKQFWKHSNQAHDGRYNTVIKKSKTRPATASSCPPSMLSRPKSAGSSFRSSVTPAAKRSQRPSTASATKKRQPQPPTRSNSSSNLSRFQKLKSNRYRNEDLFAEFSSPNSDSETTDDPFKVASTPPTNRNDIIQIEKEQDELMESLRGLTSKPDMIERLNVDFLRAEAMNNQSDNDVPVPKIIDTPKLIKSHSNLSAPLPLAPEESLRSNYGMKFDVIHQTLTPKEINDQNVLVQEVTKMRDLIQEGRFKEAEKIARDTLVFLDSSRANNPKEQQIKPKLIYAEVYSLLGDIYHLTNKETQAIVYYKKAVQFTQENGYMEAYLTALTNLGNLYESTSMYEQAIETWETKRKTLTQISNRTPEEDEDLLNVYDTMGQCYEKNHMHDKALEIFRAALEESIAITTASKLPMKKIEKLCEQQRNLAYNIANIHLRRNEFNEAIEYFERHLDLGRKFNDIAAQAKALTCLGNTYLSMSKYIASQPQSTNSKKLSGDRLNKDEYISKALYYQREAIRLNTYRKQFQQ